MTARGHARLTCANGRHSSWHMAWSKPPETKVTHTLPFQSMLFVRVYYMCLGGIGLRQRWVCHKMNYVHYLRLQLL